MTVYLSTDEDKDTCLSSGSLCKRLFTAMVSLTLTMLGFPWAYHAVLAQVVDGPVEYVNFREWFHLLPYSALSRSN